MIISVTTTLEDTTVPVAMVTCCTPTTAPAEVSLSLRRQEKNDKLCFF